MALARRVRTYLNMEKTTAMLPPASADPPSSGDHELDELPRVIQEVRAALSAAAEKIRAFAAGHRVDTNIAPGRYRSNTRALVNQGAVMMNDRPPLFRQVTFSAAQLHR